LKRGAACPDPRRKCPGIGTSPTSKCVFLRRGRLFEIAAAYAFHIAQSQAFFDGNKRTAVQAAADFLEINGIDTTPLPELATYKAMIRVVRHELDRSGLAVFLREALTPKV
jgi:death on curing protein